MADGSWLDRPSPLPRDANDPTNFPIVPYRREDLIPRWRLINDRPRSQWLELPPRNQSNATSIFRAVGASSIPKRGTENDWPIYRKSVNGELIGFTILVSSRNNYRAPLPWLAIYSIYPASSLQNARDWSIFLFHGGEDFIREISSSIKFKRILFIYNTNCIFVDGFWGWNLWISRKFEHKYFACLCLELFA